MRLYRLYIVSQTYEARGMPSYLVEGHEDRVRGHERRIQAAIQSDREWRTCECGVRMIQRETCLRCPECGEKRVIFSVGDERRAG